jgi:hypothetical protein
VTRGERRDFLLDAGAVSALAGDDKMFRAYRRLFDRQLVGSLHIPSPVMSEVRTGQAKYDALVDRMINRLSSPDIEVYISGTVETDNRAGELRFQAQKALDKANAENARKPDTKISGVDALLVAIAERLSRRCPVTILTTDLEHINALVAATGAKNIEVKLPS